MRSALAPVACAVLLAACGGGSDGDSPSPAPAPPAASPMSGAWKGSTPNGTTLNALVLDDGKMWLIGTQGGQPTDQLHATTTASEGRFQANDVRYVDYLASRFYSGTLQGSYVADRSMAGTLSIAGATPSSYNLTPIAASEFNYQRPASLGELTGAWVSLGSQISVQANGAFEATSNNGCRNTGTVAPHASGKNVFSLRMTMGAAPCLQPGQRLDGIVVTWIEDGRPVMLATALNENLSVTLVGLRP